MELFGYIYISAAATNNKTEKTNPKTISFARGANKDKKNKDIENYESLQ